jgi:hypothetical protein
MSIDATMNEEHRTAADGCVPMARAGGQVGLVEKRPSRTDIEAPEVIVGMFWRSPAAEQESKVAK